MFTIFMSTNVILFDVYVYMALLDYQVCLPMTLVLKSIVMSYWLIQKVINSKSWLRKKKGKIKFIKGWYALRDFYQLRFGGWVKLVYLCPSVFGIKIQDRFGVEVNYHTFDPPMIFAIQKDGVLNPTVLTSVPYHHEKNNLR